MKILLGIGVAAVLSVISSTAIAQSSDTAVWNLAEIAAAGPITQATPRAGDLQLLERWYHQGSNYSVPAAPADGSWTHPGERVGPLAHVSSQYFNGAIALHSCAAKDSPDRFTSPDPQCEGHIPSAYLPIHGYAASTPLPGTVPLYRCRHAGIHGWLDHFDTLDPRCEGARNAVNEGVLGYVW